MEQSATKNGKEKLKKIYKIDFNEHSRLRSSRRNEMKLLMSTIDKGRSMGLKITINK